MIPGQAGDDGESSVGYFAEEFYADKADFHLIVVAAKLFHGFFK